MGGHEQSVLRLSAEVSQVCLRLSRGVGVWGSGVVVCGCGVRGGGGVGPVSFFLQTMVVERRQLRGEGLGA